MLTLLLLLAAPCNPQGDCAQGCGCAGGDPCRCAAPPAAAALASDDFAERERAEAHLAACSYWHWRALERGLKCGRGVWRDPEVRRRARRVLLAHFAPPAADADLPPVLALGVVSCAMLNEGERWGNYAHTASPWCLPYLRRAAGVGAGPEVLYTLAEQRRATRWLCDGLLRAGVPRCGVRLVLAAMRLRAGWLGLGAGDFPP